MPIVSTLVLLMLVCVCHCTPCYAFILRSRGVQEGGQPRYLHELPEGACSCGCEVKKAVLPKVFHEA